MIKRILIGILMVPMLALAQTYPSPTFNNVTSQGTATLNNAMVSGTFTATGKVGLGSLASQAANTVVANATGSSASPTAIAAPSCSTSSSALSWTSGTGLGCNTSINAATLGGATFSAPGAIGGTTPGAASFTTLSASSTVSGTGFSTYLASPPSIGSTAAGSGAFTTLSASSTVSGTGFSNYLASPPAIGGTAAAAGSFTTLSATGLFTPSSTNGIKGTTTNDNANAGSIGEYVTNSSAGTSLSTGVAANATSISLAAGDWDIQGVITTIPAGSTVVTQRAAGISTTSATLPTTNTGSFQLLNYSATAGAPEALASPTFRVSLSATTTVYLIAQVAFTTSTCTVNGFIRARRVR